MESVGIEPLTCSCGATPKIGKLSAGPTRDLGKYQVICRGCKQHGTLCTTPQEAQQEWEMGKREGSSQHGR